VDKIKVGDKLRKGDAVITITEIYLFQMHKGQNFEVAILYDWHNIETDDTKNGVTSFSLNWEGWEKVC